MFGVCAATPMVLLTLLSSCFICFLKSSFESRDIPKCFGIKDWVTHVPLIVEEGRFDFRSLRVKVISCPCFQTDLYHAQLEKVKCHQERVWDLKLNCRISR